MHVTDHPFNPTTDPARVVEFVAAANKARPEAGYLHIGDVLWQLYQNTVFDPARHVRVWEGAAGQLLGFAWHEAPDGIMLQVHPRLRGASVLEPAMLEWGQAQIDTDSPAYDGHLWTRLCSTDTPTIEALTAAGFTRGTSYAYKLRYDLRTPIAPPQVPPGFTLRAVSGEEELPARVELHRNVWHPSRVTLDAYQRLRQADGYRADLDLVAVAPDGTLAAYCICWLDAANCTGEFEPAGTRTAFRAQGLATAVVREGLRRLQAQQATTAYVTAVGVNEAARKLYESVGFTAYAREYAYKLPLG